MVFRYSSQDPLKLVRLAPKSSLGELSKWQIELNQPHEQQCFLINFYLLVVVGARNAVSVQHLSRRVVLVHYAGSFGKVLLRLAERIERAAELREF